MTESTPPDRPTVPTVGSKRDLLESWLDWHRTTLLIKVAGLNGEQLCARSCPPSTLSLLGLVRHLAEVERDWFVGRWLPGVSEIYCTPDDREADFERTDPAQAQADLKIYQQEVTAARTEAARHQLDDVTESGSAEGAPRRISLRWIYLHLIEEYARHNGHADLLREAVDGAAGY